MSLPGKSLTGSSNGEVVTGNAAAAQNNAQLPPNAAVADVGDIAVPAAVVAASDVRDVPLAGVADAATAPDAASLADAAASQRLRQGLLQAYIDLAADIAVVAPVCDLSGRCCRFKEYGHLLYVSRPEAEMLLETAWPENAVIDDGATCPYQVKGLCTARENRPLGCRIYYCDPRYAGVGEELSEVYVDRLKELHEETNTPWEYQPVHVYLREVYPESAIEMQRQP